MSSNSGHALLQRLSSGDMVGVRPEVAGGEKPSTEMRVRRSRCRRPRQAQRHPHVVGPVAVFLVADEHEHVAAVSNLRVTRRRSTPSVPSWGAVRAAAPTRY